MLSLYIFFLSFSLSSAFSFESKTKFFFGGLKLIFLAFVYVTQRITSSNSLKMIRFQIVRHTICAPLFTLSLFIEPLVTTSITSHIELSCKTSINVIVEFLCGTCATRAQQYNNANGYKCGANALCCDHHCNMNCFDLIK